MTSSIEKDLQHRKLALQLGQSFIVQAPAGSGKTELLIQRFLTLLNTVKSPEEILAITFTKKAANEMRARVMKALQFAATHEIPHDAHQQLTWTLAKNALKKDVEYHWQLLENPNRLRIQTIDSLCTFLTKQLPLLSHFGGQPDIAENPTILYSEATETVLDFIEENDEWANSIAHLLTHLDNDLNKLQTLLMSLLAKRDQWLPFIQIEMTNQAIKLKLEEYLHHINEMHITYLNDIFPNHLLNQLGSFDISSKNDWLIIAESLLTKQFTFRKKGPLKKIIDELEENELVRAALEELHYLPDETYLSDQWNILKNLLQVLKLSAAQLHLIFQKYGQIDFIENAQAALVALGDEDHPTDLALALDYQINHLLIDEFQDTSYSQYQLLEKMTAGWQRDDGRTLFIVGDPMQSIYRFREAEVGLFLKIRQYGLKNVALTPLTLSQNFRSTHDVIHWNNKHFKQIFPEKNNIATGAVTFTESEAPMQKSNESESNIEIKGFHTSEPKAQANETVRIILEKLKNSDKKTIAVLVRSRSHLKHIIPALKAENIPFHSINIDALSERQCIQDILSLTRALINPSDRIAWLSILRAPWIGLTLHDLHRISNEKSTALIIDQISNDQLINTLSDDGKNRLKKALPILLASQHARARQPIRTWIESTWLKLGGPASLQEKHELSDIKTYFELLESMTQQNTFLNLDLLNEEIKKLYASSQKENARVYLMTIHSSKGLEFDTVILPHLEGKTPSDELALMQWIEQPLNEHEMALLLAPIHATGDEKNKLYNYIARLKKIKFQHEQNRLFYVAATRAKSDLYLLFNVETDKNNEYKISSNSFLSKLWPLIERRHEFIQTTMNVSETAKKQIQKKIRRFSSTWKNPFDIDEKTPLFIHQKATGFMLSNQDALTTGTITHRLLEIISHMSVDTWQALSTQKQAEFLVRQLRQAGTHHTVLPSIKEKIMHAIHQTLNHPKGLWILKPHREARSEFALTAIVDDKPLQLVIDRTFIDEENTRWIIDYKTTLDDVDTEKYEAQLKQYAAAFKLLEERPSRLALYFPMTGKWHEVT